MTSLLFFKGREQMHAKLEKLCPSLKQMKYADFMNFLRVFFGMTNLKNMGKIECDIMLFVCTLFIYYI